MLAHERYGSGPPLVLIQGLGSRRQVWEPLRGELARHREVIALDLPGFGESPGPPPSSGRSSAAGSGRPAGPENSCAPGFDESLGQPPASGDSFAAGSGASPEPPLNPAAPGPDDALGPPLSSATPGPDDALGPPLSSATPGSSDAPAPRASSRETCAPGFGDPPGRSSASGGPAVPGSVDHFADLVADFLDDLGLQRPELAGSSLGGGIALELGRRGRASAVTAFAPVGFWGPAGRRWCQAVVGGARVLSTALAPALPRILATRAGRVALCAIFHGHPGRLSAEDCLGSARALSRAPGFAAARRALGVRRPPPGADPGALSAIPVTIAWGTRDAVLPHRRQAARARAQLPAARHVLLPGCGHLPFADDPARCANLLTVRQ